MKTSISAPKISCCPTIATRRLNAQKLKFAGQMKAIFEANDNPILISDEAHFHLNGMVNHQNYHYWVLENPRKLPKNHSITQK